MNEITLSRPGGLAQWLGLYRLYMSAFPAAERKPFAMIVKMYRKGVSDIWCISRNGEFAGLAITINSPELILIDYLAVRSRCRGQGIGSAALKALRRTYAGKGVFLEIESTYDDAPNKAERERRKRFYLGCGMEELNVMVWLFGVKMELLGWDCRIDYDAYHAFYRDNYNAWAAEHIQKAEHPRESNTEE